MIKQNIFLYDFLLSNKKYNQLNIKKIPKKVYSYFINFVYIYKLNPNFNNQINYEYNLILDGVKINNLDSIINSQIMLTGLNADDFKNTLLDKRKHPLIDKVNAETKEQIDKFFEKIETYRQLQSELKLNNKTENRLKV